ncbi:MAG: mechanosensitive ion channel [Sphingomonas bacterium]
MTDTSEYLSNLTGGLSQLPWLQTLAALAALILAAMLANWIAKRIVLKLIRRVLSHSPFATEANELGAIVRRLSNIMPALVIQIGIGTVPNLPLWVAPLVRNIAAAFTILTIGMALSTALSLGNTIYQRKPDAAHRPIKGYIQVAKILIYSACAVLIIAALMDQSPLILLSGLGAMAAVLMLVFKDTILSLVASVQIGSNDMIRIGDWIEMPQLNADGDVIDIALHTVKVQNWDKTITTIPTHRLISESFKNWRGMSESGGRRIKRPLTLDQGSVRFLDEGQIAELRHFSVLRPYLARKLEEIAAANRDVDSVLNARRLTNVGTFRAYVLAYLEAREDIAKDKTLLVRQLSPGENGLPLEIYCFTTTTAWNEYERIQGDIFDHLLAVLPTFGLRVFQRPTGMDFMQIIAPRDKVPAQAGA